MNEGQSVRGLNEETSEMITLSQQLINANRHILTTLCPVPEKIMPQTPRQGDTSAIAGYGSSGDIPSDDGVVTTMFEKQTIINIDHFKEAYLFTYVRSFYQIMS